MKCSKAVDWEGVVEMKEESQISYGWRCQEQDGTDNQRHSYELNPTPEQGKEPRAESAGHD